MSAWWLVALLTAALALSVQVALYFRGRARYFRACKDAQVEESIRLAQMVRDGEAAYTRLKESWADGGWVRAPTNEELKVGRWS